MFDWIAKNRRAPVARLATSLLLWVPAMASAQAPPPVQTAQFDPSDLYFQGYLAIRAAEQLESSGDYLGAAEKLERARKLIDSVRRYHPEWKPEMVNGRSAQNAEAIEKIRAKADEQQRKNRNVVAELEGGVKNSGKTAPAAESPPQSAPSILEADPLTTRRLANAEAEAKRLREQLKSNAAQSGEAARNESRVGDISRQRDDLQAQLRAAENESQALRSKLSAAPVEGEMNTLNQRIAGLEQEREAMSMALTQSRGAHTEALARTALLEADLKVMQQKYSNLDRDLKAERNVANSVVAGQRTQLQALEKELTQKSIELEKANARIGGLVNELQESRDAFSQLRTERDSLMQERDQMSAMLKLNEDGRIQDLIQQNMGLAKNLREANDKVERLSKDSSSGKADLDAAFRDLAIAKSQINKLYQEKRDQDGRLADLEERLKSEEAALAKGKVDADPAEVAVLRDIIQRQLRIQERRRQARDLLVDAVKDMGAKDERIGQAIELFEGQEIQLSPDEQKLLADKNVDGEFVSPFAKDRSTVGRNTTELNRDIAVFERTAEKAYAAGRLLPTRELFQLIVEQHPGHIPALCKLGVVDLRLKDSAAAIDTFRRAVELDGNNPYARRMLGFALMSAGDLRNAEQNIKQAVELAPDDAKSHLLLGAICQRLGRPAEAESHYKSAISADPLPSDPYYNLARICSTSKRIAQAKNYYSQALERGAIPDAKLEQCFAQP